jgi:hypothetical protein
MYRLAMLLALIVLAAAGCGGSDDGSDAAPAVAGAGANEASPSGDDAGGSDSDDKAKKRQDEASGDENDESDEDSDDSNSDSGDDHPDSFSDLSPEQRTAAIEAAVRAALLQFGLKAAAVDVSDSGRTVEATITRATACRAVASEEANIVVTIQHGAPTVKSARFVVAGTGQELGYYVLGCKKPHLPNGEGRVVFEHTGVGGPYSSKRFEISTKRWALEWVNQGASLAVIPVPADEQAKDDYAAKPVGSQKPESGRYEFTGGGTYLIKAHGQGRWSVRVKELR